MQKIRDAFNAWLTKNSPEGSTKYKLKLAFAIVFGLVMLVFVFAFLAEVF